MLFDLQGKRRRVVQGTYLALAVLMGGGLVLFGIGGDVQSGLFDAFRETRGGGSGGSLVEDRVERADERLRRNPRDQAALRDAVRGHYQLAAQDVDPNTGAFSARGKAELAKAGAAWERYLATNPERPDDRLAALMVQAYSQNGLNQPAKAATAAEILTDTQPSSESFLQLALYARLAGQTRKADLAAERAVELAPRSERKAVRQQIQQIEAAAVRGGAQNGGGASAP